MARFFILLGLTSATSVPAKACLNDRSTELVEQEFRSRYLVQEAPPTNPDRASRGWGIAIGAAGLAMMVGSFFAFSRNSANRG